jgi:alpha-L-arabinofuranosidase
MSNSDTRTGARPSRRGFLTALGAAGVLAPPRSARAADSRIDILLDEPAGTIAPELHGHFTEHIGGVVYDGIWVGEGSKIPNTGGIRQTLLDALRPLRPAVIRWPGGCFADSYDWRDGVGPRERRPRRTNFWVNVPELAKAPDGPQKYDPNAFGTPEFARFCRLAGAQPYLAANVRSLSPKDFYQWVEYCNSPAGSTSLAELRAADGSREPYPVRYWGIGNESWGCGGEFTPDAYAREYRRYTAWVPDFGAKLAFIAAGPNGGDLDWTRRFFSTLTEKGPGALRTVWGWALHYYCGTAGKGQAVDFTVDDWYDLLAKADRMESLIDRHWTAMGEVDRDHRVKLVVDEWGAWHRAGTEVDPSFLFGQMPTLRDALISAITLDTFQRNADKIAMANVAQMINNLHCLFLAHEDQFVATTNYHVFAMYAAHLGAQAVRSVFTAPPVAWGASEKQQRLFGLAGSASRRGSEVVVTVVNPHASQPREAEIAVRGAGVRSCRTTTLAATGLNAHNSFRNPRALVPVAGTAPAEGTLVYRFPPASVVRLQLGLG